MAIRTRGDPTNIYSSGISVPSASLTLIRGNFVMTCAWLECLRIYFGSQRGALRAKRADDQRPAGPGCPSRRLVDRRRLTRQQHEPGIKEMGSEPTGGTRYANALTERTLLGPSDVPCRVGQVSPPLRRAGSPSSRGS